MSIYDIYNKNTSKIFAETQVLYVPAGKWECEKLFSSRNINFAGTLNEKSLGRRRRKHCSHRQNNDFQINHKRLIANIHQIKL